MFYNSVYLKKDIRLSIIHQVHQTTFYSHIWSSSGPQNQFSVPELLHPGPGVIRLRVPVCRQVGRILRGHSGRLGGAHGRGREALSGLRGLGWSGGGDRGNLSGVPGRGLDGTGTVSFRSGLIRFLSFTGQIRVLGNMNRTVAPGLHHIFITFQFIWIISVTSWTGFIIYFSPGIRRSRFHSPGPGQSGSSCGSPEEAVVNSQDDRS